MKISAYLITFVLSLILIPVVKKLSLKFNFVDKVDGDPLKIHKSSTPILGGLSVIISILIGLLISRLIFPQIEFAPIQFYSLILGAVIIFIIGLIDDKKKLPPLTRLLTQIIVGGIIALYGIVTFFLPLIGFGCSRFFIGRSAWFFALQFSCRVNISRRCRQRFDWFYRRAFSHFYYH